LLIDSKGSFNDGMSWIADMRDPKIVCHPLLVLLSDTVWNGPIFYVFLALKAWLMFTATLFIIAQSILKGLGHNERGVEVGNASRITVFVFRVFVYVFCMASLQSTTSKSLQRPTRTRRHSSGIALTFQNIFGDSRSGSAWYRV